MCTHPFLKKWSQRISLRDISSLLPVKCCKCYLKKKQKKKNFCRINNMTKVYAFFFLADSHCDQITCRWPAGSDQLMWFHRNS